MGLISTQRKSHKTALFFSNILKSRLFSESAQVYLLITSFCCDSRPGTAGHSQSFDFELRCPHSGKAPLINKSHACLNFRKQASNHHLLCPKCFSYYLVESYVPVKGLYVFHVIEKETGSERLNDLPGAAQLAELGCKPDRSRCTFPPTPVSLPSGLPVSGAPPLPAPAPPP